MNLKQFIDENLPKLDEVLYELVRTIKAPAQLKESMLYSLEAGGKRIRPLFVLAVCDLFHNKKMKHM